MATETVDVAWETVVGNCDRITLQPKFQTRNPQLESINTMLLRQYATTRPHLLSNEGGLPSRRLQQVLDYIDAHLDLEIKRADLAQLPDMSQFHVIK